jgi:pheromone shutdown protein TraB
MQTQIYDVDYTQFIHLLGTTHFSKQSLLAAHRAVKQLSPTDLAIELDIRRFRKLNNNCSSCPENRICTHKCEFIGATEALGNTDADVWLIDMTRQQFAERTNMYASEARIWHVLLPERNALMAARLAWITSERLNADQKCRVLTLVGAAHVKGIEQLLKAPQMIPRNLREFELPFTPPTLVRRIKVMGD